MQMTLQQFNEGGSSTVQEILATCAPIDNWITAVMERRPYSSQQALVQTATELAQTWTDAEVDGALAHHPRIGEKVAGESAEAQSSRAEQGNLSEDQQARAAWIAANEEYEKRFERIFLIRAKGRTSQEMMEQLQQRLQHDHATEAEIRRQQLAEIAVLRLAEAVTA